MEAFHCEGLGKLVGLFAVFAENNYAGVVIFIRQTSVVFGLSDLAHIFFPGLHAFTRQIFCVRNTAGCKFFRIPDIKECRCFVILKNIFDSPRLYLSNTS